MHFAKRNPFARLAAAIVSVVVLVAANSPAIAADQPNPDACAAQAAALNAVDQQIAAHNARPHVFEVPRQAAELAAYDAEAAQLDAARATALATLQACAEAMAALMDAGPNSAPIKPATPDRIRAIDDARSKVPPDWRPGGPPLPGKGWQVPKTSPARQVYDALRKDNPGENFGTPTLQGKPRPNVGDPDPAYPGRTIGAAGPRAQPSVSPDHIIPLAELVQMRDFMKLSAENMYRLSRAPINYQWLSRPSNWSKASRSVADMSRVDPAWQARQVALQDRIRAQLQDIIDMLVKSQG
jgi:hypothetical protein